MTSDQSSGALLGAALAGDRVAWGAIVEAYEDLIWWIARSHRLDESEAADVVQTVWLQLLRRGGDITNPDRLSSWLATTTRRESWARVKKLDRQRPSELVLDMADATAAPVDEGLLDDELLAEALVAFRQLGEKCRRLLELLCAVPPLEYAEIAALLGTTTGYIGPTRARCLDQLRAHMRSATQEGAGSHE